MKAYSLDLRARIIAACEAGKLSQAAIAERYQVSLSFVEKLWQRWRTTHSYAPSGGPRGPQRVLAPYADWVRATVQAQPDLTVDELVERFNQTHSEHVYHSMMQREVQRLDLRRKKSPFTPVSATRRGSKRSAPNSAHLSIRKSSRT